MKKQLEILEGHRDERSSCVIYTRVMGYHRPVETFNAGKKGEFDERKYFKEPFSHHEANNPGALHRRRNVRICSSDRND